jgi:hypothetical protein
LVVTADTRRIRRASAVFVLYWGVLRFRGVGCANRLKAPPEHQQITA